MFAPVIVKIELRVKYTDQDVTVYSVIFLDLEVMCLDMEMNILLLIQ